MQITVHEILPVPGAMRISSLSLGRLCVRNFRKPSSSSSMHTRTSRFRLKAHICRCPWLSAVALTIQQCTANSRRKRWHPLCGWHFAKSSNAKRAVPIWSCCSDHSAAHPPSQKMVDMLLTSGRDSYDLAIGQPCRK